TRAGYGAGANRLSVAVHLEDDRVALPAAGADRRAAQAATAAAKLVDQRADDASARRADGVPQGDRPAVHVHLLLVDPEHPHRVDRDRRERLVDLPKLDVVRRLADLLQRLLRRPRGGAV